MIAATSLPTVLLTNALVVVAAMTLLWVLSIALSDASIVDIFWGPGFVLVAWATYLVAEGADSRRLLLTLLVTVWGLRLGGYLAWRNIGNPEDFRYRAMRKHWGPRFRWISLVTVFLLQGLLMWVVSLPVQAGQVPGEPTSLGALAWVGVAAFVIGIVFEAGGDLQLARFKADPANAGKVMDRGFWRYTRHPNYFGDFMVWWGIAAVALEARGTWWTLVGPIVMSTLLLRVSGVTLLEKSLAKRRAGYAEYVQRTNAFFPWFPRS